MNREEFDKECRSINKNYNSAQVTDEMFDDIDFVYTWYPTIAEVEGKMQIAYLYMTFGFSIIQDMESRAREALKVDHEIHRLRDELRLSEVKYSQLKRGFANKQTNGTWSYPTDLMPAN